MASVITSVSPLGFETAPTNADPAGAAINRSTVSKLNRGLIKCFLFPVLDPSLYPFGGSPGRNPPIPAWYTILMAVVVVLARLWGGIEEDEDMFFFIFMKKTSRENRIEKQLLRLKKFNEI